MKSILWLYTSLLLGLYSCVRDNPLIDNTVNSWNLMVVTGDTKTKISNIQQPHGTVLIDDILTNIHIRSEIKQIVAFGQYLYILIPKDYRIIVLNKFSFELVTSIDFTATKYEPSAIAFANSTDAYIVHTNDNKVSLLDTKFFKIVRTYDVGNEPIGITYTNNLIVVANAKSNSLSLIDTKHYTRLYDIAVEEEPRFISTAQTSGKIAIVCSGYGKDDTIAENNSTAFFQLFDPTSQQITFTGELKTSLIRGIDIYPNGLAVTNKDLAFVSTQYGLFSVNIRTPEFVNFVKKEEYKGIYYNYPKEELILIRGNNSAFAAKQTTGKIIYELTMPQLFSSILAY